MAIIIVFLFGEVTVTFDQILISCSLYQKNTFLKNSLKDSWDIISTMGWMDGWTTRKHNAFGHGYHSEGHIRFESVD